ncbi:MAG: hypothetical protein R3B67_08450 [Phycisphaerales bacterium]
MGKRVYLKDIWPTRKEIDEVVNGSNDAAVRGEVRDRLHRVRPGTVPVSKSELYGWEDGSTYIQEPAVL